MHNIVPFFINFSIVWIFMTLLGCFIAFFVEKKLRINDLLFNVILGFGSPIYQISMFFLNEEKKRKINDLGEIVIVQSNKSET